jgi:hypothetical protein
MLRSDRRSGIIWGEQSQQIAGMRRNPGIDPYRSGYKRMPFAASAPCHGAASQPTPAIPVTPRVRVPARRPAKGVALFPFRRGGAHEARSR